MAKWRDRWRRARPIAARESRGVIAATMTSSRRRVRRQLLMDHDGVSPGGKRLGFIQERIDEKGDEKLGADVNTQGFVGSSRHVSEVKYGFEGLEFHFDLPPEAVELEHALGRNGVGQIGEHEQVS